jgi:leucyl-tRNA synthetase
VHRAILAVTEDIEGFRFNRAVARIRELTNALEELKGDEHGAGAVLREGFEAAVRLFGPMMPHLAEALWHHLGHDSLLVDQPWPKADPALTVEDCVTVGVQVNGKLRGTVELPRDAEQKAAEAAALALPNVQRALEGRQVRKVIVVPNRIINVVG